MNRCTNIETGNLIHEFELGRLDGAQRDAFELHLLSCDHCFEEVVGFQDAALLLRSDTDVRRIITSAATAEHEERSPSLWERVRGYLWPETSFVLKPAVMYFVIALLAYPAYLGVRSTTGEPVQGVQSLLITGTRASTSQKASSGRPLVVMFRIDGAGDGLEFGVRIRTEAGDTVFENDRFADFNDRQMATVLLPAAELSPGRYHLEVFNPGDERALHEYEFSVE